jgi:hypothetical protein
VYEIANKRLAFDGSGRAVQLAVRLTAMPWHNRNDVLGCRHMQNQTPAETYREVRNEVGKDAARALFFFFVALPLTIFTLVVLAHYTGGLWAFLTVFGTIYGIAAYRKYGLK